MPSLVAVVGDEKERAYPKPPCTLNLRRTIPFTFYVFGIKVMKNWIDNTDSLVSMGIMVM